MMLKIQLFIKGLNYILKYTKIENILNSKIISQYYGFEFFFSQINAALVGRRDFFQKHENNYFWLVVYFGKVSIDLSSDEHSLQFL